MAAVEFASLSLFSDANLVSYYKLEDVNDSKGSKTLTNNNTVGFSAGLFNNAADYGSSNTNKYFSRTDTYVTTGTDFTVAWWYKHNGQYSTVSFASDVGGGGSDEYYMIIDNLGNISYHSCNSDGSESDTAGGAVPSYNNAIWHHIAFIGADSGSDWIKRVYVDGAQISTSTETGKTSGKLGNINIGRIIVEGTALSTGLKDDLVIFNRALTAEEIGLIYNGPTVATSEQNYSYFM